MSNEPTELLELRIDALKDDVKKVETAVDRAEKRGQFARQALASTASSKARLNFVSDVLKSVVGNMDDDPRIAGWLDDARINLARDLRDTPQLLTESVSALDEAIRALKEAKRLSVTLSEEGRLALQSNLKSRCNHLTKQLDALITAVQGSGVAQRRGQWDDFRRLLEEKAQPLFIDYVDFLGGLTMRDTGLDDEVCDMTDRLLKGYTRELSRSLPLPARQAALGNVLESVVLLGFPEWSIWGIPLVGHEVGMAYLRSRDDAELLELASKYLPRLHEAVRSPAPSEAPLPSAGYVHHLIADVFATYTLGLCYAASALLLRLTPRHDEPRPLDHPRDIDRARVIMMTISLVNQGGASFSDSVGKLTSIWAKALRGYAGPTQAEQATQEMAGPPPEADWIDDLTKDALDHFTMMDTQRYDDERWRRSEQWMEPLKKCAEWPLPYKDDITDLLTAAWRLRLEKLAPDDLAENITKLWGTRQAKELA